MKKFVIFIIISFAPFISLHAAYKLYQCDNEEKTYKCNDFECDDFFNKILPNSYINFDIQKEDKRIFKNLFINNHLVNQNQLKGCMFIDYKNWQCIAEENIKEGMINGMYYLNDNARHYCGKISFKVFLED